MLGGLTQMGVLGRHLSEVMSQLRGEGVARRRGRGGPGGRNGRARVEQWELGRPAAGLPPPQPPAPPPRHHPGWKTLLALPGPGHSWAWTAVSRGPPPRAGATQVPASSEQPPPPGRVTWQLTEVSDVSTHEYQSGLVIHSKWAPD